MKETGMYKKEKIGKKRRQQYKKNRDKKKKD